MAAQKDGFLVGQDWTSKLYFEEKDFTDEELTGGRLVEELGNSAGEQIELVSVCKCPLSSRQRTAIVFNHKFVLFKTEHLWWTIEKNSKGITIQRSKEQADVKERCGQEERCPPILTEKDKGVSGKKVNELLEWLHKEKELHKPYDVITSNCKHFAKAVVVAIAQSKQ